MIDLKEYGRRARAARILAGCDAVKDAVALIEETSGIPITARQLYAIERGEVPLLMEWFFAISMTYNPPGGLLYWEPCYTDEVRALIRQRIDQHREDERR